ncbi:MAG: hypothetical protein LBP40_05250 [Campylobacteraceae bacterium]|jgi:hypothetical protein|nr:hypothetical protein [Campylobacteraceae bacterium]
MKLAPILLLAFNILILLGVTIMIVSIDFMRGILPFWIGGIFVGLCLGIFLVIRQKRRQKLTSK